MQVRADMALSSSILKKPLDIKFDIDFSLLAGTARMLGVDISASSIKVVELSRKGSSPCRWMHYRMAESTRSNR